MQSDVPQQQEDWRDIRGWEGVYQVSSLGRVKRLARFVASKNGSLAFRKGGATTGSKTVSGYREVQMTADGRKERKFIHVLVCETFHGPKPASDHQVRHLDGTRANNAMDNLAWGTPAQNAADQVAHGTNPIGERAGNSRLTEPQVLEIRRLYRPRYGSLSSLAARFGVTSTQIHHIVNRRQWAHI